MLRFKFVKRSLFVPVLDAGGNDRDTSHGVQQDEEGTENERCVCFSQGQYRDVWLVIVGMSDSMVNGSSPDE